MTFNSSRPSVKTSMSVTTRSRVAVLALCVCLVDTSRGSRTSLEPAAINPAYPDMCFDETLKMAVAVGGVVTDHVACVRLTCLQSNLSTSGLMKFTEACTFKYQVPADCQVRVIDGDISADFPGCCPKMECECDVKCTIRALD